MKKKIVFIMGTAHCGSTLLTLVLGSHSDCRALGEVSNIPDFYRHQKPICSVCQGDCSFWDKTFSEQEMQTLSKGFSEQRLHKHIPLKLEKAVRGFLRTDQVLNPYSLIASKVSETVLVDSTKTVYWLEKKLAAREFTSGKLDAQLIHLIRDGRAVMNSYSRRKHYHALSAEQFGKQFGALWMNRINAENSFFDAFSGKKLRLRYEEFATQTEDTLQKLCNWLALDFQPGMIQYWRHEHHTVSGNTGTHALIKKYQGTERKETSPRAQLKAHTESPKDFRISLDQRWRRTLSDEQIAAFYKQTNGLNKAYEWA